MGVVGVVGEVGEVRVVGVGEGREVTQHTVHRATQQNPCVHSNSTITCVYFYILHLVIRVQS